MTEERVQSTKLGKLTVRESEAAVAIILRFEFGNTAVPLRLQLVVLLGG